MTTQYFLLMEGKKKIYDVLSDSEIKSINIPIYQRQYAWETSVASQLLTDIIETQDADRGALIGLLVFINREEAQELDVVDGQQRITTVMLLLGIIRSELRALNQNEFANDHSRMAALYARLGKLDSCLYRKQDNGKKAITLQYGHEPGYHEKILTGLLVGKEVINELHPRFLEISKLSDDFEKFETENSAKKKWIKRSSVEGGFNQTRAKGLKVTKNFLKLETEVNQYIEECKSEAEKLERLIKLTDTILDRVNVIVYSTRNEAEAFNLFETLNDRGMAVAAYDLIKSFCIQKDPQKIEEIGKLWNNIFSEKLEGDKKRIKHFLRTYYNSHKPFISANDLFDRYKKLIMSADLPSSAWIYDVLLPEVRNYELIEKGAGDQIRHDRLANILFSLRQTNSNTWMTIALSACRLWKKHNSKKVYDAIADLLKSVLQATIVLEIKSLRGSLIEQKFPEFARSVNELVLLPSQNPSDIASAVIEIKKKFEVFRSENELIGKGCAERLENDQLENKKVKPLFCLHAINGVADGFQLSKMTVEHVAPVKPKDPKDWFGGDVESHAEWHVRIGNFLPLKKEINSSVQNKDFASKKKEYEKVNVTDFLEDSHELNWRSQSVWTKDLVEKRGKLVAKRLEELL